jgi:glutamate racemase
MTEIINNNNSIGFFDSGVGGLSVLSRFKKVLPNENTIYFGDTIHLPYGNKTKDELIGYAKNILDFFNKKGVKAVVIACNTSSAQAYDSIKNLYPFPIYPIIQCCAKGVANMGVNRVGVFATEATVKSGKYALELSKYNPDIQVKEIAARNWVGIVEGVQNNREENIKNIKYEISNVNRFLTCIVKPNNKGNCENETYMVNDILFRKKHQFVII